MSPENELDLNLDEQQDVSLDGKTEDKTENQEPEAHTEEAAVEKQPKPVEDEKYEKEKWVIKRLKRQEDQHRRDMVDLLQNMQQQQHEFLKTVLERTQTQSINQQPSYDESQQDVPVDVLVARKVQQEIANRDKLRLEEEKKSIEARNQAEVRAKIEQIYAFEETLRDKYDDYDDVANSVRRYASETMAKALLHLPPESLENFYEAWKSNPEQIINISKMSPEKQYAEMIRLDARLSADKVHASNQSSASSPKILTPIKSKASEKSVGDNLLETSDQMLADMMKSYKRR